MGRDKNGGYTILEIVIFLTVSSFLFLLAALAINGKQSQSDFFIGVSDFKTKIDDVINDISTGFYPAVNGFKCTSGGKAGSPITVSKSGGKGQATNQDCIFLGKVLWFDTSGTGTPNYSIITVAANRLGVDGLSVIKLNESNPIGVPFMETSGALVRAVVVTQVYVNKNPTRSFGIFTDLPQTSSTLTAGSLSTDIVTIPNSGPGDSLSPATYNNIKSMSTNTVNLNPSVVICLRLGTTAGSSNRRAAIVIGSHNRQVTTETHIGDVDDPAVTNFLPGVKCQ
ncbi:MAG TPA: hypothetical protein VLF39_03610 [Candidatus Saccharimonadales bacterium]|nr:hypothetical protein [Candidatus Saccharimonadales bacterium]